VNDEAIRTDGLTKIYADALALDRLDLRVPRGAIYGYLGRNGAGKSTTIKILLGLARATSGTAAIFGLGWPRDGLEMLQRTAYVDQQKRLFAKLTGEELVRFNRPLYTRWSDELATRYARQLEVPMHRPFARLSVGNQTKMCLLLALAQNADLLILDEPIAELDPVVVDEFHRILVEDYAAEGRTIFLSSHNLAEVEKISDWVGILHDGRLLLERRLDDLRSGFRRVSVAGRGLPTGADPRILSAVVSEGFTEYVVTSDAGPVAAELRNQGAVVLDVAPMNLEQVFLTLVRKEQACTIGNAGAIRGVAPLPT
jgi:ABC-2 type transport system ATP-binding protein